MTAVWPWSFVSFVSCFYGQTYVPFANDLSQPVHFTTVTAHQFSEG
mgnify:CR=1 FL=1